MTIDDQIKISIDAMWRFYGSGKLAGLTPYEAARKVGAQPSLAEKVVEKWDGPDILK